MFGGSKLNKSSMNLLCCSSESLMIFRFIQEYFGESRQNSFHKGNNVSENLYVAVVNILVVLLSWQHLVIWIVYRVTLRVICPKYSKLYKYFDSFIKISALALVHTGSFTIDAHQKHAFDKSLREFFHSKKDSTTAFAQQV